jgi:O-antigen ligase
MERSMRSRLTIGFCVLAILIGAVAGWFGGGFALALVTLLFSAAMVAKDYRIGVVTLIVVVPFSGAYDQSSNVFMLLVAATLGSFILNKAYSRQAIVALPRVVWVGLVSTVLLGAVVGYTHLGEAQFNLQGTPFWSDYSAKGYFRQSLLFPLGMIIVSWLLANAVRDSQRPERFFLPLALVGIVMVVRIVALIATSGLGLEQIQSRREFFSELGHHANEFGPLLAVASAPFLFLVADSHGSRRWLYGSVLVVLLTGVTLVFSRGGYVAFLVVLSAFLVMRGRLRVFVGVALVALVAALAVPDAVLERVTTGMNARSLDMAASRSETDELTAGRFALYSMFAPEVLKSPIWGSGTGSNAWSTPVRNGWTLMLHPHNMYLRALMDVGVLGLLALGFFWWKMVRGMRALSNAPGLSPAMRSYFAGAMAGNLGAMAAGFSGGNWLPSIGDPFLWYAAGMALGFWDLAHASTVRASQPAARASASRAFGDISGQSTASKPVR